MRAREGGGAGPCVWEPPDEMSRIVRRQSGPSLVTPWLTWLSEQLTFLPGPVSAH